MDGYEVRAAPGIDGAVVARALLAELPGLRPSAGKAALEAALTGRGGLQRFRPHRAAFLLRLDAFGPAPVLVKIYTPRNALETTLGLASASRGWTSWKVGRAMLESGLPTPEPLLLLSRKPFRVHRETVLVTRALESPVLLTDEFKARLAAGTSSRPLLAELAALAARIHDAGFFHGDFTASNLVVAGPGRARRLEVIDLDRAKNLRMLPVPARRAAQILDLRMLLLTTWGEVPRSAWLRLLSRYAHARRLSRLGSRRLAYRVLSARRGRMRVGASTPTVGGSTPWGA